MGCRRGDSTLHCNTLTNRTMGVLLKVLATTNLLRVACLQNEVDTKYPRNLKGNKALSVPEFWETLSTLAPPWR